MMGKNNLLELWQTKRAKRKKKENNENGLSIEKLLERLRSGKIVMLNSLVDIKLNTKFCQINNLPITV